jgi:hypothetical protein
MPKDSLTTQDMLVQFLRADIDTALIFLKTAAIDAATDPVDSRHARDKALEALVAVRHLLARVNDPATRTEIESRADILQNAIAAGRT